MIVSSLTATHVLLGLVMVFSAKVLYDLVLSPLRHFRGPFLARFSDSYRAILTLGGRVDESYRKWHREWGTAVRVGPNAISIGDPDLIKVIYATKNPWLKSDMYKPNDVVVNGQRIPNIFNTSDLAFHAKYSNPIRPFWSMTQVLELEPYIDETLNDVVGELQWRFADSQGSLCSMEDWLAYYTWDTAANMSFGSKFGFLKQGRDVDGMIAESTAGLRYFAPVSQMPWVDEWLDKNPVWRIGPRPLVNGVMTTIRLINEYQQESARDEAKPRKAPNFFDKYSTLKGKLDFVDDAQVVNWIMLNVLAGGDSTAGALRSFIYHVSRSPAAREALVAELDDAQVSLPAQWREIKDLGYLDAAGLEAQRLTPAVGLMLEREVPAAGFELPDGRVVPAGTKVGINPCVITRDVGVFGEDVAAYRPERWLRHQDETEEAFVQRRRRMFDATDLMYGAGNRICMGKHLAKMMMYKLVATLFVAFDIKPGDPNREWNYFNAWFMYQTDMPMKISRRVRG